MKLTPAAAGRICGLFGLTVGAALRYIGAIHAPASAESRAL
ncbi:hypothetical protein ACFZC5_17740 [Nocardia gamkensis]